MKQSSKTTIGILGLGLFGSSVARTLAQNNVDVIAMDKNMEHLEEAGFGECDEVVIASARKLEDTILAILNFKKLHVPKITVKIKNIEYQEVLKKVGATLVILPEVAMGYQTAMMLANPTVHELMKLDSHYNIIEFPHKEHWVGKKIEQIDFRKNFDVNIIALQHEHSNDFSIEFGPDYIIQKGDLFIGITNDLGMKKLM